MTTVNIMSIKSRKLSEDHFEYKQQSLYFCAGQIARFGETADTCAIDEVVMSMCQRNDIPKSNVKFWWMAKNMQQQTTWFYTPEV